MFRHTGQALCVHYFRYCPDYIENYYSKKRAMFLTMLLNRALYACSGNKHQKIPIAYDAGLHQSGQSCPVSHKAVWANYVSIYRIFAEHFAGLSIFS